MISTENLTQQQRKRAEKLNLQYFNDIHLTDDEIGVLQWLVRWDDFTVSHIASAFKKISPSQEK